MSQSKWALSLILVGFLIFSFFIIKYFYKGIEARQHSSDLHELEIFTHSSFMSSFGPGPELAALFEKRCSCRVKFTDVGSGGLLIQRLKLKPTERVDLIVGLDQLAIKEAFEQIKWNALDFPVANIKPELKEAVSKWFIPYDFSPMTFIYRKSEKAAPQNWQELVDSKMSLSLQDPRTSTPGMQFLFWIHSIFSEVEAINYLRELKKQVHSVSPSWSSSYGLFKSKQSEATFSYLTSIIYHWVEEKDESYQFLQFSEGHPLQIEYVAVPARCLNCKMAKSFVTFMLEDPSQKILMQKNYMLPVVSGIETGTVFERLPKLNYIDFKKLENFDNHKDLFLKRWEALFREDAG